MSFAIQAHVDRMHASRTTKKAPNKEPRAGMDPNANRAIQKALESQKSLVDGIPTRKWGDVELGPIKK